jgi:hypothetical protein
MGRRALKPEEKKAKARVKMARFNQKKKELARQVESRRLENNREEERLKQLADELEGERRRQEQFEENLRAWKTELEKKELELLVRERKVKEKALSQQDLVRVVEDQNVFLKQQQAELKRFRVAHRKAALEIQKWESKARKLEEERKEALEAAEKLTTLLDTHSKETEILRKELQDKRILSLETIKERQDGLWFWTGLPDQKAFDNEYDNIKGLLEFVTTEGLVRSTRMERRKQFLWFLVRLRRGK